MDRLLSMEVFVTTVELGSFSAAAEVFKITPPMVSKHIAALEKRLGGTLLARTTRRQHLTELGLNFYQNCKQILRDISNAEVGAEALVTSPKGNLKVTASLWFGSLAVAPVVCDYLKQFPDVSIHLSLTDRYVDIMDESFDVAIRIGELKDSSLIARKIADFEVTICASPDYLASAGTPNTPTDLVNHECLGFSNWNNQGGWQLLQKTNKAELEKTLRFESNNGQALLTAAINGIGITMQPKELLRKHIDAGELVEILKEYVPPSRPIYAVYPSERQFTPKLTTFVAHLIESFKQTRGSRIKSK